MKLNALSLNNYRKTHIAYFKKEIAEEYADLYNARDRGFIEWRVVEIEALLTWFGWLNFIFNRSNAITQDTCYREIVK